MIGDIGYFNAEVKVTAIFLRKSQKWAYHVRVE